MDDASLEAQLAALREAGDKLVAHRAHRSSCAACDPMKKALANTAATATAYTERIRREAWIVGMDAAQEIVLAVEGDTLPRDIQGVSRAELDGMGFRFEDEGAGMFVRCALPTGWSKHVASAPYWSDLVDEKGVVRARIFYKAAFYDQRAFMRWGP